jgi:soluble lytic murein transglycosylase-like protein
MAKRPSGVARASVASAVLVAFAGSFVLLSREPPPPPAPQAVSQASPAARVPRGWSVKVDGWVIEVDGVVGRPGWREAAAAVPAAEAPEKPSPLSPYDRFIGRYADDAGFDWRLISAVISEESGFQEEAESPAGAYGLMQVRDIAARDVGQLFFHDPESNIRTGVSYLKRLEGMFSAASGRDRLGLILAAYNMGPGHVQDAQSLARRYGYDPMVWAESMQAVLPLLEESHFYEQLPNGYAQGSQTVEYVERVLARFDQYRRTLSAEPPGVAIDVPSAAG